MLFRSILLLLGLMPLCAQATSSSKASKSPMGGNGHNITFDGRLFVVTTQPAGTPLGWYTMVLRPGNVTWQPGGKPNLTTGALSAPKLLQAGDNGENALALCETDPDNTPYACDDSGAAGGPYACYDLAVFDSNAYPDQYNGLRKRTVKVWIDKPNTGEAQVLKHVWAPGMTPLKNLAGADLRGIEPTVTRDGRLLLWQGKKSNNGDIDRLIYAVNDTPCGAGGWDGPHNLTAMVQDPKVTWPLGDKHLRASDGTTFGADAEFKGAYPWLFPDGDALIFTSTEMPCVSPENPPGCGPRRNGLAVIGYPTNWGIGHIDGALNPSTKDNVRLFFSSPGPGVFQELPATGGADVWPFFGSNTANYADVVFDASLDGQYAGVWHMNESVTTTGKFDLGKTPDSGGYFNTALVKGATFPDGNNAPFGKGLVFNGQSSWLEIPDHSTLNAVNGLTVEMWLKPHETVNCDAKNNYRVLIQKGPVAQGAFSLVFEEGEVFQARVKVGGEQRAVIADSPIPVGEWSHIGFTYDAGSGALRFYINGDLVSETAGPALTLDATAHKVLVAGPGKNRPACPDGDGVFSGVIDELRISRVVRDLTFAPFPGNRARFVSWNIPAEVAAGKPFQATVTMRNIGTTRWSPASLHRLGSQAPQDNGTWGTGRIEMPAMVMPGETVSIVATLTAPATLGPTPMQWRMVQEGAEWFGELTPTIDVAVVESVPEPEPEPEPEPTPETAQEPEPAVEPMPDTDDPAEDAATSDTVAPTPDTLPTPESDTTEPASLPESSAPETTSEGSTTGSESPAAPSTQSGGCTTIPGGQGPAPLWLLVLLTPLFWRRR